MQRNEPAKSGYCKLTTIYSTSVPSLSGCPFPLRPTERPCFCRGRSQPPRSAAAAAATQQSGFKASLPPLPPRGGKERRKGRRNPYFLRKNEILPPIPRFATLTVQIFAYSKLQLVFLWGGKGRDKSPGDLLLLAFFMGNGRFFQPALEARF